MKRLFLFCGLFLLLGAVSAYAVPTLQVGVSDGSGGWLTNTATLTDPTEEDTVVTSGTLISFAGLYKKDVLNVGGQYGDGDDWSTFELPTAFDGHGAVALVSVPDGWGAYAYANLRLGGDLAFYTDADNSYFPNEHDPVKADVADFLFFDIGDFANLADQVVDFQDPGELFDGEIKNLMISGMGDLAWIHFDLMAIVTSENNKSEIFTNLENNPGSHDVTWKDDGGGGGGGGNPIPEPSTLLLMGAGLLGLGLAQRMRR
jgi:hypothetical protein